MGGIKPTVETYNAPRLQFFTRLGEESEIEVGMV
jgi:hypothetical protein